MLVIISDLHLTDGSSGATISSGAFQIFLEALEDLALNACWRVDGSYRPLEVVDVVLLGDVLDLIRSSRWLQETTVRPWSDPRSTQLSGFLRSLTANTLSHNEPSLALLRKLAKEGLPLPAATSAGQPAAGAIQAVPVRIWYMVGNHDWFFHLSGAHHNAIRQLVIDEMGLANAANLPFPHDPAECEPLLAIMRRHKVLARHGDVFDPFNFTGDRDASSLGDAIVIELLTRFAAEVHKQLHGRLPVATLAGLRELDNVRPLILVPVWIDGLLNRTCPFPALRTQIKRIWDTLADEFLELPFIRQQDTWNPADLVDGLQRALKFSKRLSIGWASSIVDWMQRLQGSGIESYYGHALREPDFRSRRAKHVVYGHTHFAESVPLDASFAEGYVLNQVYFNSGTWRRVHRQTRLAPAEHEFVASECMTYLAFFQQDERSGRPYETWSGTLGINPAEVSIVRVDRGRTHATGQGVSASGIPGHGPHFALSPAHATVVPRSRV